MEEKNNVVDFNAGKQEKKHNTEKLSYEKLNEVAIQLSNDNRQLSMQCRQLQAYIENINRLDYLFNVLKYAHQFPEEFVEKCATEIREAITLPEKPEANDENPESNEDA